MKRIQLISSPRNISTALMYSFANRDDTKVVDEPYYGYYLNETGKDHPGRKETIASQNTDIQKVYKDLLSDDLEKSILFVKQMAKHFLELDFSLFAPFSNIILIRNPYQLIASYSQLISNPLMEDIGANIQHEIYKLLVSNEREPIILDSGEVLKDPESVLSQLCVELDIPFTEKMLKWESGPIPEDGTWAKYWYENVHNSTGFSPQKTSQRRLKDRLMPLYEEAKKYYDILYQKSIKAN